MVTIRAIVFVVAVALILAGCYTMSREHYQWQLRDDVPAARLAADQQDCSRGG